MEAIIFRCNEPKPAGMPVLKEELYSADAHDFNVVRVDAGMGKPPHPYTEGDSFMLVLRGLLNLQVDGNPYTVNAGELILIPKGATRGFKAGSEGATFFAAHLRG